MKVAFCFIFMLLLSWSAHLQASTSIGTGSFDGVLIDKTALFLQKLSEKGRFPKHKTLSLLQLTQEDRQYASLFPCQAHEEAEDYVLRVLERNELGSRLSGLWILSYGSGGDSYISHEPLLPERVRILDVLEDLAYNSSQLILDCTLARGLAQTYMFALYCQLKGIDLEALSALDRRLALSEGDSRPLVISSFIGNYFVGIPCEQLRPGDFCYLRGVKNYLELFPEGNAQGENLLMVRRDDVESFIGFGENFMDGALSKAEIQKGLLDAYFVSLTTLTHRSADEVTNEVLTTPYSSACRLQPQEMLIQECLDKAKSLLAKGYRTSANLWARKGLLILGDEEQLFSSQAAELSVILGKAAGTFMGNFPLEKPSVSITVSVPEMLPEKK